MARLGIDPIRYAGEWHVFLEERSAIGSMGGARRTLRNLVTRWSQFSKEDSMKLRSYSISTLSHKIVDE